MLNDNKWIVKELLPENSVFQIGLHYDRTCKMLGVSFLKFTLWFTYGGIYKKGSYGQWIKCFDIGLSNYYTHDFYQFIKI